MPPALASACWCTRDKQSSPGVCGRGRLAPHSKWDNSDVTWIELEGAVNVRDLGGLPTSDGGTTVAGRLLRSENLQELSPGDVTRLVDEIGVTTVVDLRSTNEVAIEGPAPLDALAGVRHAHHPVLREFLDVSDTVKAALVTEAAQADRERYPDDPMCGHYLGYLENRPEEVTGALRSIVTAPGAAIVHCAAGKDRTGVVVALALTAAGVEPEAIVADYAASGERIEAIIERLARSKMYAGGVNGIPVRAHTPRTETMKAFLEQLGARYGGVEAWLTANGFSAEELAQLRAKLRQA
jgi:protein-tyrosine phosphatase